MMRARALLASVAAMLALIALDAPAFGQASSKAWSQFRDNPQGTSQANVVGAQTAHPVPGFPATLPTNGPGTGGDGPGGVAVSAANVAFVGQGPTLTAWSPSGRRLWSYNAAALGSGDASPNVTTPALSLSGSTVYALAVMVNAFASTPSSLIAVNASTGQLRWSAPVGTLATGGFLTQPTVTVGPDGSLYVAADIAGAPGQGPAGSAGPITGGTVSSFTPYGGVNWSTQVPPVVGGPVLDPSGNIYVSIEGGGSRGGDVIALNSSGGVLWSTALGSPLNVGTLETAPLISPGGSTVFVGTNGASGAVYALSTSDGAILGSIGTGGINGTLALSPRSGYLFARTPSGLVSALPSGGGSAVWSSGSSVEAAPNAPAIGADGTIYTSAGGTLLAAAGATGATKWSFTAPGSQAQGSTTQLSSPAIGPDGTVYVTSQGFSPSANQLYAFELT